VRRQPRGAEHQRCPPRVREKHRGRRKAAEHLDQPAGDEIDGDRQRRAGHPEVEVARYREVAGELWILEVTHAWWPHAGLGKPIIKPCGGSVAQVSADCLVDRGEHLKEDEDDSHEGERAREALAALHRADEQTHRDREDRGQHAAKDENRPPNPGERAICLRQDAEKLPFVALAQPKHFLRTNSARKRRSAIAKILELTESSWCSSGTATLIAARIDNLRHDALRELTIATRCSRRKSQRRGQPSALHGPASMLQQRAP